MTEGEILRVLEGSGIGKGTFTESQAKDAYLELIAEIGNGIAILFKDQIDKDTKSDSGTLGQSAIPIPTKNGFEIQADYYYKFIDDGVSGVGQFHGATTPIRSVVSNGVYSFKNLGVPEAMARRIKDMPGVGSMSHAYAIGVNIKNYGIKPKNITDKVVTDAMLERISQDLLTATGLIVTASFNSVFK
jgi:hypothetical protein